MLRLRLPAARVLARPVVRCGDIGDQRLQSGRLRKEVLTRSVGLATSRLRVSRPVRRWFVWNQVPTAGIFRGLVSFTVHFN